MSSLEITNLIQCLKYIFEHKFIFQTNSQTSQIDQSEGNSLKPVSYMSKIYCPMSFSMAEDQLREFKKIK